MKRLFAFAFSALLSVTLVAGSQGAPADWESKVDSAVLDAAALGPTDFIVYMSAHADLAPAGRLATKDAKGLFVYDALTTTARMSQAPLVARLAELDVSSTSFWIANSVLVNAGDLALIREVALRSDVEAIYAVGKGELQWPVDVPEGTEAVDVTATVGPSLDWVRADEAWALGYRGQGAVVAGADTGVRWTHSALKTHYRGWDAASGTANHNYNWHNAAGPNAECPTDTASSQPCDDNDHGTHTVGTMVGEDPTKVNQIGMAPEAEWIACRNMSQGFGVVPTYMDCMQWFIAPTDLAGNNPDPSKAPDVVNNSWGCVEVCAPPMLKDMIDASRAAGIFYAVSAGNDNQFFLGLTTACNTINFPLAVYDAAFTVGATNATNDTIASFSSLGPVVDNPVEGVAYRKPDIVAPGVGIRSATAASDTSYANLSGTSMSGPHVAGLVALVISANPELRGHVDTIEQVIRNSAKPLTSNKGCGGDSSTDVPNNVYGWGRIDALAAVQLAVNTDPGPTYTRNLVGLPAQVIDVQKETLLQEHPTTDYSTGSAQLGTTTWRVVKDTGNCCENHLGMSADGRLFDIGGSYVNYSDDRGQSWKSVRPLDPLVNGEGSMAMAPNGDVVAMTWDAYSGDHFVAYKYNAETGEWKTLTNVLHEAFYDRPWLTVVPGPFTDATGKIVPYISMVEGGVLKDPLMVSTDGLLYAEASSITVGDLTNEQVTRYFPISADASFDWIQPIRSAPVTALGGGYAMDGGYLLDPETRQWSPWRLPGNVQPPTYIQIDSAGRIHNLRNLGGDSMEYRISADGGQTWSSATFPFSFAPDSGLLTDFKVNLAAGVSAAAIRRDSQDWLYKFDISGDTAKLLRVYRVGLGDNPSGSNVGALTEPRMDFQTVVIFPDGRVATSFLDSTTFSHPPGSGMLGRITPAMAVEVDTTFDVEPTPTPEPTPSPTPEPTNCLTTNWLDTLEPTPRDGWQVDTAENALDGASPTWAVSEDLSAHSPSHSWYSNDPVLGDKDDRLIAPEQLITSATTLSFWHRFYLEQGFDGGVLEVSTNGGANWLDVTAKGSFSAGGYNGSTASREAWTGGSETARLDEMTQVVVSLGGFVPEGSNVTDALVRFRLMADQLVMGDGWWLDDVEFSNVLDCSQPGPTPTPSPTPTPTPTPALADVTVSDMTTASQKPKEGDPVVINAVITNRGAGAAGASRTEFRLDGDTVLGVVDTPALAPGASATVSVGWDTHGVKGEHVITATADSDGVVVESNESNNVGKLTLTIKGNKVQNSSFEEPDQSGSQPEAWQGSSTGAGETSWEEGGSDGEQSASISGTGGSVLLAGAPDWTSDVIAVTPGEVLDLSVDVATTGVSSAPSVSVAYLGAAGELLSEVTVLTAPLSTDGFTSLTKTLTVPANVTGLQIVLLGFAPTDTHTAGTVTFDNVGLYTH